MIWPELGSSSQSTGGILNIKNKLIIAQCQGSSIPAICGMIFQKKEQPEAVNLDSQCNSQKHKDKNKIYRIVWITCI